MFEKVIQKRMLEYLEMNGLINEAQHGFRPTRSCLTQLILYYDDILNEIESGAEVDSIYCDFEKCFDKVDFGVLLEKLKSKGIVGKALSWFKNFLTTRTFRVRVGHELSDVVEVISGFPQGTVTGPVLLLVMNSDLDKAIKNSKSGSFADDSKMYRAIKCDGDVKLLQEDLDGVQNWAKENNMKLNEDKFVLVTFNKNPEIKSEYTLKNGCKVVNSVTTRDLGVVISNDAKFTAHISKVTSDCRKLMGMIFRTFKTRKDDIMMTLYKSLILSKIDYCSVLYSPSNISDLRQLEKLQANFTMRMECAKTLDGNRRDYWERLECLGLYSIERRFERYIVIFVWKVLNGIVYNPGLKFSRKDARTGVTCEVPKISGKLREVSFRVRGPKLFNSLPKDVRKIEFDNFVLPE